MFTSKLPISTSVRRPTNSIDNRPSNIPVTVRKANLFTPQTKRSFQAGTSTAGKSFTSGSATERKFQRSLKPAPDRDAQQRMFDNLTDFIRNNAPGFPCPDAKKFFSSVSTTESSRIFELLISRLIQDFKVKRLEIDVPEALATLDYPFIRSVTKSSLVSVTTRQAAAGLLHIFDWLAQIILSRDDSQISEDDDLMTDNQWALKNSILNPDTVYEENKKVLMRMYSQDDVDRLDQDHELVQQEQDRLQQQMEEIESLNQVCFTIDEDIKKCREYRAQMQIYLDSKVQESEELERELRDLKVQLEEDTRQIDQWKHEINTHKLDIDQVNRECDRLSKLGQTLQTFRDQRLQADAELKLVEDKCQRLQDRYQESIPEYHKQLRELADLASSIQIDLQIPQNLDTEEDLRSAITCLKAFSLELHPILSGKLSEINDELQQVEVIDARYSAEVFPRLQEEIDRVARKREVAERHQVEVQQSDKSRMDDLERRASQQLQDILKENGILREKSDQANRALEGDRQNFSNILKSSRTHFQAHLESHKQRVYILMKDAEQEAEDWKEAQSGWDKRKLIVNKAYKLLKCTLSSQ